MSAPSAKTILLVEDDDALVVDLLALWHPDGVIQRVSTPEEATRYLGRTAPDLVILDLCLPSTEADGLSLLALIRRQKDRTIPVIIVTASTSVEARRQAQSLQVSAILNKPLEIAELDQLVREILTARGERRAGSLPRRAEA